MEIGLANPALEKIRLLVLRDDWATSTKVRDRYKLGDYGPDDVKSCLLHGVIRQAQRDELGQAIDGKKYVIAGPDAGGLLFVTVGKIVMSCDGNEYFVINAFPDLRS